MARTLQVQLDDLDDAIHAIETGAQSYGVGGRRVDRGKLSDMYKERAALQAALDQASGGGGLFQVINRDRPT